MASNIINIIKKISLDIFKEHETKILFGKVTQITPLTINISDKFTLTHEVLTLNSPVEIGEMVILMKYSTGGKYLVLSTVEKVYKEVVYVGGSTTETSSEDTTTVNPNSGQWKDLGVFKITHYCCEKYPHICNAGPPYKTATGTTPHVGGCAVDPSKIPLGSYIKINDVVYHAEDTGGSIKGNRIDVVVETHAEALNKGTYSARVYLKVGD